MATIVKLTYEDGRTEEVKLNPRTMILAERHFKGDAPAIEGTMWAAWNKLGRPGGDFDAWSESVDDIDQSDSEVRPTPAAGGDGS